MNTKELLAWYEAALRPVFGDQLQAIYERDDFSHMFLDGDREEFFFTLYGTAHVRLYWCNECFIFCGRRNDLVSSDTFGEIVYEGEVHADLLPPMIAELVTQLRDSTCLSKKETVRGRTPSGYDEVRDYVILARTNGPPRPAYRLANLSIQYVP